MLLRQPVSPDIYDTMYGEETMNKRMSSRSGLFLLELIISILFFSLASAVCIQLFVKAHLMDQNSRNLTNSIKLCENFAEIYTSVNGDITLLSSVYADAEISASENYELQTFCMYYDSDWESCSSSEAAYLLSADFSKRNCTAGILYTATVHTSEPNTLPIYELTVTVYVPERGGVENEE